MSIPNWQKAKSIFDTAVELRPDDRANYLAAACNGDGSLRRQVEELLASYQTCFLEPTIATFKGGADNQPNSALLKPGQLIGRYEVMGLVGLGGMGEVYIARDGTLDRPACLKVFAANTITKHGHLERLIREARSASALNHPHICTIYEINTEHDPPFIAMEYVEGQTLAERIALEKFDPQSAVDIALQIADGLAEAHDAGIVHRDIKPANIIINKRGQVKIVDFGLAKKFVTPAQGQTLKSLTQSGTIVGTVSYMSPEQARGQTVDARTDVWSLGVVLYEMLTGKHPFPGDTMGDVIASILRSEPPFVADFGKLPPLLERILKTSLAKEKWSRYASARQMAHELEKSKSTPFGHENKVLQNETTAILPANSDAGQPSQRVSAGRFLSPAYDLYMRGRVKASSENHEEVEAAIRLLENAVLLDPGYAEAYAALAQAYTTKAFQFAADTEKKQIAENAEVAVEKALALNPNLAEGQFARGVILWTLAKRFPHEQAIQAYKRAIALNPNLDEAHHRLGLVYFHVGLLDQAREEVKKALEINPNNTMARFRMGTIDAHQGKHEGALAIFKTIPREISPSIVDRATADSLVHLGRLEDADALVDDYLKTYPQDEGGNVTSVKAVLLAMSGKQKEAETMILRAIKIGRGFGHFHHTACNIASAYAILNKPEEAVKWLRDAADNGFPCYPYFELDRNLDNIRDDPAFVSFMSDLRPIYRARLAKAGGPPVDDNAAAALPPAAYRTADASGPSTFRYGPGTIDSRYYAVAAALIILVFAGISAFWYLGRHKISSAPIESIAVMPFESESGSPDTEYLGDGLTESLIGRLSALPGISVKARSSVFRYKGKSPDPKTIASDLGVQAVLNGRILKRDADFTLYVELVDAATDNVIWKSDYNRPAANLVAVQAEIVQDVLANLRVKLSKTELNKATRNYTENAEAYQLYLKGRYYWDKRDEESYRIADDAYKRAIALDPNYALAYAGLADLYLFRDKDIGRQVAMPLAKQFARKALEIDETLAEAHNTLAFVNENYDFDMPAAEAGFKRAIELKPNYAVAHQFYGGFLMQTGRTEQGLAEARRALDLEPYSVAVNWYWGMLLGFARRYDEAIAQQQRTLQIQPNYALAEGNLASMYVQTGRYDDAAALINTGLRPEEQGDRSLLAVIYIRTGRESDARKVLNGMIDRCKTSCGNTVYGIAKVYAALGDKDEAIRWLNTGYEQRVFNMFFARVDPSFDSLHGDPRYKELIHRIGLTP